MPPNTPPGQSPPPFARLVEMGSAYWISKVLAAAAELEIADRLAHGARRADEIAADASLSAPHLYRLMRTLAALGVLHRIDGERFALTELGEALRSDHPAGAAAAIRCLNRPWFSGTFERLATAVRTGRTATDETLGTNVFEFLAAHEDEAALFTRTMVGFHGMEPPAVAAAYDFSSSATIVDVGGASGNMLAAILERFQHARGVLFDRPHVVATAPDLLRSRGVADRVEIIGGDFFAEIPSGGDCYVLSHVLHDWPLDEVRTILDRCRSAMRESDRLLIVEAVLPEGDEMHPGRLLDMTMLAIVGGQERTAGEYAGLLIDAGFRMTRIVPTASAASIVEAIPYVRP